MTTLGVLCARVGLDAAAARQALSSTSGHETPWYVQVILGLGAWLTALAVIAFVAAFMHFVLGVDEPGAAAALLGAVLFGLALALLLKHRGVFAAHLAIAGSTAGAAVAAVGIGVEAESLWAAAGATAPFAVVAIWQQREPLLQFLLSGLTLMIAVAALLDHEEELVLDVVALGAPLGLWLYLRPPAIDLRPTAAVLLLATPTAAAFLEAPALAWISVAGWLCRAVHVALFLTLIGVQWQRSGGAQDRPQLAAIAIGASLAGVLLPPGAAAALLLLMLAYTLGLRVFAILGAQLEAFFIWRFYYDLEISLLHKSLILTAVGTALLVCYGLVVAGDRAGRTS